MSKPLLPWLLAASICWPLLAVAEPLSDFERFRAYPFMDRAHRAAQRQDWPEVESLTRHLLGRVPHHRDARQLLTQALLQQHIFAEAHRHALALADDGDGRRQLQEVRLAWIRHAAPEPGEVSHWLRDSDAEQRRGLWQAYSLALQEREGAAAALAWLEELPAEDDAALRRWRAVFAEQSGQQQTVIEQLQPLLERDQLDAESWLRLGAAYVQSDDHDGLQQLLAQAPDVASERQLRRQAAAAAIARNQPALVRQLARELERPCLETVYWLVSREPDAARAELADCPPGAEPGRWLELAIALEAETLLADTRLGEPWDTQRRSHGLLLREARGTAEPKAWVALYRDAPSPALLDSVSYRLLVAGESSQARQLLEEAFTADPDQLQPASLVRLADLYARPGQTVAPDLAEHLLARLPREAGVTLLQDLAQGGHCALVREQIPARDRLAGEYLALARCAEGQQPGAAVVYHRAAMAAGVRDNERALAYALFEAGDAAAATDLWLVLGLDNLSALDALAASRSALAAERALLAEVYWHRAGPALDAAYLRLGAAIALTQNRPDEALVRDRQALASEPDGTYYHAAAATALAAGDEELGLAWLAHSVELAPDQPAFRLEYALRLAGSEQRERRLEAIPWLEQVLRDYPADFRLAEALALRYAEAGETGLARETLRLAIDGVEPALVVGEDDSDSLARRHYAQRRSHEALSRRHSWVLASSWSPGGSPEVGQVLDGDSYQMAQWDYALGREPVRDGKTLSVYGRVLGSGESRSDFFRQRAYGLGLRGKPLGSQNLNLYGELYYQPVRDLFGDLRDSSHLDLLLRATGSFFDGGDYRNDWRPVATRWWEQALYTDLAWFVRQEQAQAMARYHRGKAFKLGNLDGQTLMPYALVQGSARREDHDLRAGLGLRWQWWFDDSHYSAYRARLVLRAEYQRVLDGDLYDGAEGWSLGMELLR